MSFYEDAYKSNITWSAKDRLSSADTPIENIAYFSLTEESSTALNSSILSADTSKETKDFYTEVNGMFPIWKLFLLGFGENHSESFSLDKGVCDSFTVMSTGTNVIKLSFSGLLLMYKEYDYRLDFLYLYDTFMRGYQLESNNMELQMTIENTIFNYKPFGLQYSQSVDIPDFVRISMSGIAYKYYVLDDIRMTNTNLISVPNMAVTGL